MSFDLTRLTKMMFLMQQTRIVPGLLFLIVFGLVDCSSQDGGNAFPECSISGPTMGTTYHIKMVDTLMSDSQVASTQKSVDSLLLAINQSMSTYIPTSEISQFNASTLVNSPIAISSQFMEVLKSSLDISRRSHGAFDITVMPLVNFYGFGFQKAAPHLPTDRELDSLKQLVGMNHLQLTETSISKEIAALSIDLSAIAKGYGVDAVSRFLLELGFQNTMVEIGGEVVGRGHNNHGQAWQIGIDRPFLGEQPGETLQHIVALDNRAIATSGDYRNYREVDGTRISHTIDPRTGKPISHQLASVSIIAKTCMIADGTATAVMVMGKVEGLKWLEATPDTEGLLIVRLSDGNFQEFMTSGFNQYLVQ